MICYLNLQNLMPTGQARWDFRVRRQYLLQDIWTHINNAPTQQFKLTLMVRYQIVLFVSSEYIAAVFFGFQCY